MAHGEAARERFWAKVNKTEGCWEWTGLIMSNGYGHFFIDYRGPLAHRWAYEDLVGEIPEGLVLDHLCRNRKCVRPDHLEPVTRGENVLRGTGLSAKFATATHCVNGHEFTPENTQQRSGGGRSCRACNNRRQKEYTARLRERRSK